MMYLNELMEAKNMTRADLSRASSIPESTLRDILNDKARLDRCEVATVMCLAEALDTTVEDIMINYWEESFEDVMEPEQKKLHDESSTVDFYMMVELTMHKLHASREMGFVKSICDNNWIELFYMTRQYRSALFLLGLIDYLCRKHHQERNPRFDAYRNECLDQPVYSLRTLEEGDDAFESAQAREYTENHAVPELARFNIFMTEEDITPKK